MRHHGEIPEDRRGLAVVAGLLLGIVAGASLLSWTRHPSTIAQAPTMACGLPPCAAR